MTYPTQYFGFYKLIAWQAARDLTRKIYATTAAFPRKECYGVTSQLQRASSSIGAQIAEGSRMSSQAHRKIYYERAYASGAEVANFLELAHDLQYVNDAQYQELMGKLNRVSALTFKLAQSCTTAQVHL